MSKYHQPRRLVKNPYAWECIKVILAETDPRDALRIHGHISSHGDVPQKYKLFDDFMFSIATGKRIIRPLGITRKGMEKIMGWRSKGYRLPIADDVLQVISFLPYNLGLKTLIAKDAMIKEGFFPKELYE